MLPLEKNIVELLLKADEAAIDLLYDNYGAQLYGYLLNMLGNEAEAQDVLQDSFVKIWRHGQSYSADKSRLFTWVLRICRNTALDRIRSKKRRPETTLNGSEQNSHIGVTEQKPEHIDIRDHLNKLDVKYIEVVKLLFFQGFTQKEASEALGIPLGTVKTRLRIALRELKKLYAFNTNLISVVFLILWTTG